MQAKLPEIWAYNSAWVGKDSRPILRSIGFKKPPMTKRAKLPKIRKFPYMQKDFRLKMTLDDTDEIYITDILFNLNTYIHLSMKMFRNSSWASVGVGGIPGSFRDASGNFKCFQGIPKKHARCQERSRMFQRRSRGVSRGFAL